MQKILVVDDDKDMCHLVSSILKEEGYRVEKAYDGGQAIKRIKAKGYNLIVLDYKLPDIKGINLLQEVRRIDPSIRVIMLSAYGSTSIKSMAKKFGVYKFIDKPFDINRLLRVVRDALSKKVRAR
jgi:DNA-binding NtrC family response regulator